MFIIKDSGGILMDVIVTIIIMTAKLCIDITKVTKTIIINIAVLRAITNL